MSDTHGLTVQQADALWDAVAIPGPETPTFMKQHERVCRTVTTLLAERPYQEIKGHCPGCGGSSLFVGDGGYVTCARLECPDPTAADDLLHSTRPTTALRQHLTKTIDEAFSDNYRPGEGLDTDATTTAVLAALTEHLNIGEEEAWCKTCRRVWEGVSHRCESDAEQRLAAVRDALASFKDRGVIRIGYSNLDIPTASEVIAAVRAELDRSALDGAEQSARTTVNNPTTGDPKAQPDA